MNPAVEPAFDQEWFSRLAPHRLFSLADKVAVVTGGAGGIGRWLSAGLALAGATVVVTDRDHDGTQQVADALTAAGLSARPLLVDLEDDDSAARIVDFATDQCGCLDVVINNAGINQRIPMLEVSAELLEHVWKIDYIRGYQLAQAAARAMIKRGGGSIIHISSLNNQIGLEDVSMLMLPRFRGRTRPRCPPKRVNFKGVREQLGGARLLEPGPLCQLCATQPPRDAHILRCHGPSPRLSARALHPAE